MLAMALMGFVQLGCMTPDQLDSLALSAVDVWNRADESYVRYKDEVPCQKRTQAFNDHLDVEAREIGYPDWETLEDKAWGNLSTDKRLKVIGLCTVEHAFLTKRESQRRLLKKLEYMSEGKHGEGK
jgi:hypothetical protein